MVWYASYLTYAFMNKSSKTTGVHFCNINFLQHFSKFNSTIAVLFTIFEYSDSGLIICLP